MTSDCLQVFLLGGVSLKLNGHPYKELTSQKATALFSYLICNHRHSFYRDELANLLYGDLSQDRAMANLRVLLSRLRTLNGYLDTNRHTVAFNPNSNYWLDAAALETQLTAAATQIEEDGILSPDTVAQLETILPLYRGDFLAGFHLSDALGFEEWRVVEQERIRRLVIETLEKLVRYHLDNGQYQPGLKYATQLLQLDPLKEEVHRQTMLLLARTGQQSAALAQYDACCRILTEELNITPSAETKNLYERIRTIKNAHRSPLPTPPTPLIGREDELAKVAKLLANPNCRLLTLFGPGGIGKTRIALQAAADQVNNGAFLEGVYLIPLASVSSPEFLVPAIANVLQISIQGAAAPETQLLDYLRTREILLVLDNFEHLLSPAQSMLDKEQASNNNLLAEILHFAPQVKLLITSRERLNLHGEWLFEIRGLEFPDKDNGQTESIENYSAVQLFLESAHRLQAGFSVSKVEEPYVIRICQLVEGMPLAVELAASWVRTLSCKEIAIEIKRNIEFLTTSLRDMPTRHRSMQAVFDHSWQLLTEQERDALRKLSIFRGGFSREAARQVADASLPILSSLVDKSFLRQHTPGRYEIHELLRQYAEKQLQAVSLEEKKTQDRYTQYYTAFLRQQERRLKRGLVQEALIEIGAEIENVRLGWRWATEQGKVTEIEQGLEGLWFFYDSMSWYQEGETAFRRAVEALESKLEPSQKRANGKTGGVAQERKMVLGQVLTRQGYFCFRLGAYKKGKLLLEKGLSLLRRVEHNVQREIAISLCYLGLVDWFMGNYIEAIELLQESITICREIGEYFILGHALIPQGLVSIALGEYDEAEQLLQECLAICQEMNEQRGMSIAIGGLGIVTLLQGDLAAAKQLLEKSLALTREVYQVGVPVCLDSLGTVALLTGAYEEAKQLYQESIDFSKTTGDQWGIALALTHLGNTIYAMEDYQTARQHFLQALEIAMEIETYPIALEALVGLARLLANNQSTRVQALEYLSLAMQHPASSHATKAQASQLFAASEAMFSIDVMLFTAQNSAEPRTLEEVVHEVLNQDDNNLPLTSSYCKGVRWDNPDLRPVVVNSGTNRP